MMTDCSCASYELSEQRQQFYLSLFLSLSLSFALPLSVHQPPNWALRSRSPLLLFVTADKTDEKFHRRASVKMGVRVIYRTDVFHHHTAPENFAAFAGQHSNASTQSPPASATPPLTNSDGHEQTPSTSSAGGGAAGAAGGGGTGAKSKSKSERGESFPKLRLSPKSFRFSGRFGRSKSEIERCPNDPFHCYSKSFQEVSALTAILLRT